MFEQAQLLEQLGPSATQRVVERLHHFAIIPDGRLEQLATDALSENWGQNRFVLEKYLAVHVAWSIEQGRYTHSENQLYTTAGSLQTRYGTPLYLVFQQNTNPGRSPWVLVAVGSNISAPQLPLPPEIPAGPVIPRGAEVVIMHDHVLGENAERVEFLRDTPRVAQLCAVSGAIQWSLFRRLELPYWYYGRMNYVVPLYLRSREDISLAPDLVAPIEVAADNLLVRTVLLPHMPYANARVAVKRHDALPHWLLDCWNQEAERVGEEQIENPEG
jgi:hypothetical protein